MNDILSFSGEYRFLSNFWPCLGSSVEHHYQAAKTDDPRWAGRILAAPSASAAKRIGREAPMRATWDAERIPVMRSLLVLKFRGDLATRLLSTGEARLIEGNTWGDTFWGVCAGAGENHLGKSLMWVRATLWWAL